MDKIEATQLLQAELDKWQVKPYAELLSLLDQVETFEITLPNGNWYQFEVQVFWNDKTSGELHVSISIDDGGWRAFHPLTRGFTKVREP